MASKYTKDSRGYYHARVWDGTYVNGRKHYKSLFTKKSSKELERMVAEVEAKVKGREYVINSDITFIEYAIKWESIYKANKEANTRAMYQNIINKHLTDIICPIGSITRAHYVSAMNNIKGSRTKEQTAMVFKQIIKSAIHDKLLPASALEEITDGLEKPKHIAQEKRPLTENEKNALKNANFSVRDKAFVYLLYGCGMRRGEAAALTVDDFDFDNNTVLINKAKAYVGQMIIDKDTKNHKHRTVPIPPDLAPYIYEYVKTIDKGEIFAIRASQSLTKSSLDKMWRRILKQMQEVSAEPIEGLTPHIFRHNYCTKLCYRIPEISINDIAYLMGDSKQVVLNIYNHLNLDEEKISETVAKVFNL